MPPANGNNPKMKPPPSSMRRTFYSHISMDENTRDQWMEEADKRSGLSWFPCFPFGPACIIGIPLYLFFILPLLLLAKRTNSKFLQSESAKWIPNTEKLGGLAFKGRLDMDAAAAGKALHSSLVDALGAKYRTVFRFGDMYIVAAMLGANPESMGMTKLYIFLKPLDANSCTVYCRVYKRLLAPFENQFNAKVDRPSRATISKVLSGLGVQDVEFEWFTPAGQPAFHTAFPVQFSLSTLADDDSAVKRRLESMVTDIKSQVDAVIFAYVVVGTLALLVILLFILMALSPNGLNAPHAP
jgi:hypothetical protein